MRCYILSVLCGEWQVAKKWQKSGKKVAKKKEGLPNCSIKNMKTMATCNMLICDVSSLK
jgi:hypothetical protein